MIDPRHETPRSWTTKTALLIFQFGTIPILFDDKKWHEWADYVVLLPALAAANAPRAQGYHEWQQWALDFNLAVQGVVPN